MMAKHTARVPAFSRIVTGLRKAFYKAKTHRANRKRLKQARDIAEHTDKRLNSWDLD